MSVKVKQVLHLDANGDYPFKYENVELSDGKKATIIRGAALTEGLWNDLFYPAETIAAATPSLMGLQLRINHSHDAKDVIGKITNVKYSEDIQLASGAMAKGTLFESTHRRRRDSRCHRRRAIRRAA